MINTENEIEIERQVLYLLCERLRAHEITMLRQLDNGRYLRGPGASVGRERSVRIQDIFSTIVGENDYVILTKTGIFTSSEINSLDINLDHGHCVDSIIGLAEKERGK